MGISPLPRKAKFGDHIGKVMDEVSIRDDSRSNDYRFFIQQIHWKDGTESIRFAYYKKPHGSGESSWRFARSAPSLELKPLRKLIRKARQKSWFRI
jgi:hypothetical protein